MTKRTYTRRTDEEIVAELEAKIALIKQKQEEKERPDKVVLKELPKFKKRASAFAQVCMDNGRGDVGNSILAFLTVLERQANELPS
ncbi:MAG: hypothetical protein ISQ08_02720 [Planctomycetes bacterium]|nr:hypothetical protein [Planctomycetota bacterium]